MPENITRRSKPDLDDQSNALKESFPASDSVTIGEASAAEPDRPLHRRPAMLDTELVNEIARNVEVAHEVPLATPDEQADLQRRRLSAAAVVDDSRQQPAPSPIDHKRKSGNAEQRALSDAVSDLDSRD